MQMGHLARGSGGALKQLVWLVATKLQIIDGKTLLTEVFAIFTSCLLSTRNHMTHRSVNQH